MEIKEFLSMQLVMHIGCATTPEDPEQTIVYHPGIASSGQWGQSKTGALYMGNMTLIKFAFGEYTNEEAENFDESRWDTVTFVCDRLKLDTSKSLTDNQTRTLVSQIAMLVLGGEIEFPVLFSKIINRMKSNTPYRYMISNNCVVLARANAGNISYDWTY